MCGRNEQTFIIPQNSVISDKACTNIGTKRCDMQFQKYQRYTVVVFETALNVVYAKELVSRHFYFRKFGWAGYCSIELRFSQVVLNITNKYVLRAASAQW